MGLPWAVLDKIFGEFQSQFFLSIVEVFSTFFSANTSISKGEFFKSVLIKRFLEFFTTIIPYFSYTYLSFSLLYLSYRRVVVRLFLGDQSV